jgi:hypothetical protein
MHDSNKGLTLGAAIEQLQRLAAEHGPDLEFTDADGDAVLGFQVNTLDGTVAIVDRHADERQFRPPRAEQAQPRTRKNVRLDDNPDDNRGDEA